MFKKFTLVAFSMLCISMSCVNAQTIDEPIEVTLTNGAQSIAPGATSYVTMTFKVPYGLWMGAEGSEARAPSGTEIKVPEIKGFTFEKPHYPEPQEGWIPAKLGKTLVYQGIVNVVIPFTTNSTVAEGKYELDFSATYTPGYSAGKLATHNNRIVSTTLIVSKDGANGITIPNPSTGDVSSDFAVGPLDHANLGPLNFVYNEFDESKGFAKFMHKVAYLDKPDHGKNIRAVPVPFLTSTNVEGSSVGLGVSLLNSTREGTMTGSVSLFAYSNEFIGAGVGIQAVSCPGAYHNYQLAAYVGGENYRFVTFAYEDYTIWDSKLGVNVGLTSINEPRARFAGIGPGTLQRNITAYELTNNGGVVDLFSLPVQNFRVGLGASYNQYDTGRSFQEVVDANNTEFLQDSDLAGSLGLNGANLLSFRANFIFDHKDQEFTPARGFVSKLTLYRTEISDIEGEDIVDNFYGLDLTASQYFSRPSQRVVVLLRGELNLKSESNLPFYTLSTLGGLKSLRAYDLGRWRDQHAVFGSAEVRYTITKIPVLGYPMSIEIAGFLDVGQVFNDRDGEGLGDNFSDDFNLNPGFSIRMINKPNVGLIFNYAYGKDGGYISGGIGLPF